MSTKSLVGMDCPGSRANTRGPRGSYILLGFVLAAVLLAVGARPFLFLMPRTRKGFLDYWSYFRHGALLSTLKIHWMAARKAPAEASSEDWYILGSHYERIWGDRARALVCYERGIKTKPVQCMNYYMYVRLMIEEGRAEEAIATLLDSPWDRSDWYGLLARLYEASGDVQRAILNYKRAIHSEREWQRTFGLDEQGRRMRAHLILEWEKALKRLEGLAE